MFLCPLTTLAGGSRCLYTEAQRFSHLAMVTNPYRGQKLEKEMVTLLGAAQEMG